MRYLYGFMIFNIIILVHELGHFIFAKAAGIYVEEFAFGIGPTLVGKSVKGTKFCIKVFPFGGCCMMKGEEDGDETAEDSYNAKTKLQRFLVLFAGPFFNIVFAVFCSFALIMLSGVSLPVVGGFSGNAPAAKLAGMDVGDTIISIDGKSMATFKDVSFYNASHQDDSLVHVVYRNEDGYHETDIRRNKSDGLFMMGLVPAANEKVSVPHALQYSIHDIAYQFNVVRYSLALIFRGAVTFHDVNGPIGIVKTIGDGYQQVQDEGAMVSFCLILYYLSFLSANIGIMNLLPVPALDGGRIMFILAECIAGRRIKREEQINTAGMVALLTLMVLVMVKDILVLV